MLGDVSCVICHVSDRKLRFFHVPKKLARLEEWSQSLNGLEIKASSLVCEKHFLKEHFSKNLEYNCWRLNRKAIPTLDFTDEKFDDFKLVNENICCRTDVLEDTSISKQSWKTNESKTESDFSNTYPFANCLWCSFSCPVQNMYEFIKHITSEHRQQIESFELTDHDTPLDDIVEDAIEEEVKIEIEKFKDDEEASEMEIDMNEINENSSIYSDNDDFTNDFALNTNQTPIKENKNDEQVAVTVLIEKINIETSDPSLIFYLIDLIQKYPQLWFINTFKSKEYEAALTNFSKEFFKKYPSVMTQTELHECLIEMRDWYQKMFEEGCGASLPFPKNKYFHNLADFLPDQSNGKTCEICGCLFQDHVQYFAHKQLEHLIEIPDTMEKLGKKTSLGYLKEHANEYFHTRYPLYQAFSYDCQICPFKLQKNKNAFIEHIKTHLDIREHVCDICGKSFVKRNYFLIHRKRHFGLYKFKCLICGRDNFTNGSLLTSHRKRYHRPIEGTIEEIERMAKRTKQTLFEYCVPHKEGERTYYACICCERKYKRKTNAHFHFKKAHKDQIPFLNGTGRKYACPLCEHRYAHRNGLYVHLKRAHREQMSEKLWKNVITKYAEKNSIDF